MGHQPVARHTGEREDAKQMGWKDVPERLVAPDKLEKAFEEAFRADDPVLYASLLRATIDWLAHHGGQEWFRQHPKVERALAKRLRGHALAIDLAGSTASVSWDFAKWMGTAVLGFFTLGMTYLLAHQDPHWPYMGGVAGLGCGSVALAFRTTRLSSQWRDAVSKYLATLVDDLTNRNEVVREAQDAREPSVKARVEEVGDAEPESRSDVARRLTKK